MSKKLLITGLIFLFLGMAVLGWVIAHHHHEKQLNLYYENQKAEELENYSKAYQQWLGLPENQRSELPWLLDENGKVKTAEQIESEQQIHLFADIDELAESQPKDLILADILYGSGWEKKVAQYKAKKIALSLVLAGSILCSSSGALVILWWSLIWVIRKSKSIKKAKDTNEETDKTESQENSNHEKEDVQKQTDTAAGKKSLNTLLNCHSYNTAANNDEIENTELKKDDSVITKKKNEPEPVKNENADKDEKPAEVQKQNLQSQAFQNRRIAFERLYTDEESARKFNEEQIQVSHLSLAEAIKKRLRSSETKSDKADLAATEKLLSTTLEKLSEEITAIRRYASEQQERIKKLQDGYDWNIIKNFCLRVIRCVDNLENRINNLDAENSKILELEEIKDELLFALESSGVEQFSPEIESDYKGQERTSEAVRDKKITQDKEKAGKIAEVLKSGYRYCLDESNYKVIRTAQVKLFD